MAKFRSEQEADSKAPPDKFVEFETVGPLRWDALIEKFDSLAGWVFRGQADANWSLRTSLERETPAGTEPSSAEKTLLEAFRRRAHTYLDQPLIPENTGEWLALMQHFGAPTRLLDVTASPYVAAYFALESIPQGIGQCAVWAVQPTWFYEAAGALAPKSAEEKNSLNELIAKALGIAHRDDLWALAGGLNMSLADADTWLTSSDSMVLPFIPKRLSERMSVQQGSFLVPRNVDQPFMDNLRALGNHRGNIKKILIDTDQRGRALSELRLMNITRASLFPGLEGYAQSLRTLLITEPDEPRNIRLALRGLSERFAVKPKPESGGA